MRVPVSESKLDLTVKEEGKSNHLSLHGSMFCLFVCLLLAFV